MLCPNPDGHTPLPQIIAFDELRTDFKNPIDQATQRGQKG